MKKDCTTCRHHRHLLLFDTHVCRSEELCRAMAQAGVSSDMFIDDPAAVGCEYWRPKE